MSSPVLKHPRKSRPALHGEGVILGVDTHKDVHVAAILRIAGVLLATHSFATTHDGYAATLVWAHRFGDVNAAGIECTGSYGSALMLKALQDTSSIVSARQTWLDLADELKVRNGRDANDPSGYHSYAELTTALRN